MSGPIVRKYGFPNFEQIFGHRPLEHGVDSAEKPVEGEGTGLPPDLPKGDTPVDANSPEASGTIAPSTEFGSTGG